MSNLVKTNAALNLSPLAQHLDAIVGEAQRIVNAALNSKGQA